MVHTNRSNISIQNQKLFTKEKMAKRSNITFGIPETSYNETYVM